MADNLRDLPARRTRRRTLEGAQPLGPAVDPPAGKNEDPTAEVSGDENVNAARAASQLGSGQDDPKQLCPGQGDPTLQDENLPLEHVGAQDSPDPSPSSDSAESTRELIPDNAVLRFCKKHRKVLLALLAAVFTVCVGLMGAFVGTPSQPSIPSWIPWRHRSSDHHQPRILLWGRGTRLPAHVAHDLLYRHSTKPAHQNTLVCPSGPHHSVKCEVTNDTNALMLSDAIVYYADTLDGVNFPIQRHPDQLWVFWARKDLPPSKTKFNSSPVRPALVNLFNLTMGHREDADIAVPHKTWRCDFPGDNPIHSAEHGNATVGPMHKKEIAWILGVCEQERFGNQHLRGSVIRGSVLSHPPSRDSLPVPLHLITGCGRHRCASLDKCVEDVADHFHFILVSLLPECFQSSYEVIFSAFRYDLVPVVMAPSDAKLDVPDNSVITTADLQGPGDLAKFLRELLDDPDRYESFFTWKRHCAFAQPPNDLCALCRRLWRTSNSTARQTHPNVADWWMRREKCYNEPFFGLDYGFEPAWYFGSQGNST